VNGSTVDVCLVVCDSLRGLPDAIADVSPAAIVQACVLYLIRSAFILLQSIGDGGAMPRRMLLRSGDVLAE
jgi:transposase-like protein